MTIGEIELEWSRSSVIALEKWVILLMPVAVSPSSGTDPNMTCVSFSRDFANVKKVVRSNPSKKRLVTGSRQHRQATGPPLA
jgi:hypothetical protein